MAYGYIYKISFPNGKCYIGFTTRTIKERWVEHNKHAKAGNTRRLYNAVRKYNMVDTFQMIVIDTAETEEELCEKEIAHIEINNSNSEGRNGYNMNDGGDGVFGYRHTEEGRLQISEGVKKYYEDNPEARQKTSEASKKCWKDNPELRKKILDAKGQNKPFDVFKKNGTFIKSFNYQFEAREYLQKTYKINTHSDISAVLRGTRNSSHGFIFKYKE
tara:strand:+ start:194 stop:841 length:648 start_codon:yes stop_codon:yes gene_type:complete